MHAFDRRTSSDTMQNHSQPRLSTEENTINEWEPGFTTYQRQNFNSNNRLDNKISTVDK